MTNNLFPYPGNKARHAEWIIQHIPEHTCYVEPFGGAAGVLFNKPKSKVEVYNDVSGDIVHFFRTLRDRGDELREWLEHTPFSRELHDEWSTGFYSGERPDSDIERAGRFFYLRYSQFGSKYDGVSGFKSSRWDNDARKYRKKTDALESFADRLRDVIIQCGTYAEMIGRYDGPDTVFYLDPPYVDKDDYDHYSTGKFDHGDLYDLVSDIEGRCIISYDSVPRWYGDGFQVVTRDSTFKIDSKDGEKEATEYLLMNFDADGEQLMSDVGQQGLEAFTDGGKSHETS